MTSATASRSQLRLRLDMPNRQKTVGPTSKLGEALGHGRLTCIGVDFASGLINIMILEVAHFASAVAPFPRQDSDLATSPLAVAVSPAFQIA